ncbi:MAG: ion transporter, partial [Alphaproteobacteria bacterium]
MRSLRLRVYRQLEPTAWPRQGLSPVNWILVILIIAAVFAAVIETEPTIAGGKELLFGDFELAVASIFLIEYAGRVWTVV